MRASNLLLRSLRALSVVVFAALRVAPVCAQTSVMIHDIMTNLPNSPYLYTTTNTPVSVSGIVVGVMSTGGFYISETSSNWDTNAATAEGMPVFYLAGGNPACAVVGNLVTVVGNVTNGSAITGADTPGTGITPTSCTVTGSGTMTKTATLPTSISSFGQLLPYTGMAVTNNIFYAISPTGGTLDEPNETVTSNGQFWGTLTSNVSNNYHVFRNAGIGEDEFVPSTAPATVLRWAGAPQRILIDTATFGGPPMDLGVGQMLTCSVPSNITLGSTAGIGLIDYSLGYARLLLFASTTCTISGSIAPAVSAPADSQHFHVGSLDLYRFYNTLGNSSGAVAITQAAYTRRLAKAANAIVNAIGRPDIVALQEVQDISTLTDIANATNALAGTTYVPYLTPGNDPESLNLGFLVNTATITVDSVTQVGAAATYTTASGGTALLWQRPPLVLRAEVNRTGENYQVTVINQHITPRDNIGDPVLGPDIRAQRAAQASAISVMAQNYQNAGDNLLVAGNFDAYSFNDGYVDVVNIIVGDPAAAPLVTLYQASSTTSQLYNFESSVTNTTKYNIIEHGLARSIEHIFVSATNTSTASAPLSSYATTVTQSHFTTDYPYVDANDATTAAGLTPHDGFVAAFLIPPVPTTASIAPAAVNFGTLDIGASTTQTVTITNTSPFTSTVVISNIAISGANAGDFSQTSNCTSLAENATCTVTILFTPAAAGPRTGTLTVTTDSPNNPTLTASLSGTGLDTTATLTPATQDFGSVYIGGGVSAAKTFTVTNTSTVTLSVGTITVTAGFSQTNTCSAALAAGASCTISVIFAPTAAGAASGTLTVANSSTADPSLTAALTGTGLATIATIAPASLTYASTLIGSTTASQVVTWTNANPVPLTITTATVTGDFSITSTTCSGTIAANASCIANIVFAPTALGTRSGTFTVVSSSSANPALSATLTGTGAAAIVVSPATLSFGLIDITQKSAPQLVTLTNNTNAPITITSIATQGDYANTATTCGSALAGLSSCTVTVVFTPTAIGVRSGTLTFNTGNTQSPSISAVLTGNGVDFSIASNSASGSVIAGYQIGVNTTLTPLGGFSAPVQLSCTTNAPGSTCTTTTTPINLSSVTLVPFTITTTSQYTVIGYGSFASSRAPWSILMVFLCGLGVFVARKHTRNLCRVAVIMLLLAVVLGGAGCSGKLPAKNADPTLPGTYTYTFSATDGTLTHTAAFSLTVSSK